MLRYKQWLLWSAAIEGSGGEAPATPEPSSDAAIAEDINSIFEFDPFAPPKAQETPPAGQDQAAPTSPVPPAAPVAAPAAPVPPTAEQAAKPDPLVEAAQALRETAAALQAPPPPRQAEPPAAPQEDEWQPRDGGQVLNYQAVFSQIPDQLVAALGSENPLERKQAISQVLAISTHVAHRLAVKQAVEHMRNEFATAMPRFVQSTLERHQQQQTVYQDFYGKFPQLANPAIRPVVMQAARDLAAQTGARGWTPEFRDRLGEHVLNMLRGVVPAAAPPAPTAAPQMTGGSARPPAPPATRNQADDMFDMLRM